MAFFQSTHHLGQAAVSNRFAAGNDSLHVVHACLTLKVVVAHTAHSIGFPAVGIDLKTWILEGHFGLSLRQSK